MIHTCRILCNTLEEDQLEDLGIKDPGVWVDAAIETGSIIAIKRRTADKTDDEYYATTVYMDNGDVYVIDTPFPVLLSVWKGKTSKKETNAKL